MVVLILCCIFYLGMIVSHCKSVL